MTTIFSLKKVLPAAAMISLFILGFFLGRQTGFPEGQLAVSPAVSQEKNRQASVAKTEVNYSFLLKNSKKTKARYDIVGAERREEIVVKGQKIRAVEGKEFLILAVKVVNEAQEPLILNSRDYLRLSEGGEWLAPEIHNDPLEVQAISTRYTKLGFAIAKTIKTFQLQVGEITGEKKTIDLNFGQ